MGCLMTLAIRNGSLPPSDAAMSTTDPGNHGHLEADSTSRSSGVPGDSSFGDVSSQVFPVNSKILNLVPGYNYQLEVMLDMDGIPTES